MIIARLKSFLISGGIQHSALKFCSLRLRMNRFLFIYIQNAGTRFERSGFGLECDLVFQSSQRSCSKIGKCTAYIVIGRVLGKLSLSADANICCRKTNSRTWLMPFY